MSRSFADLGVPASIVSNLSARGIDSPFPIQEMTLPDALAGRDLCGKAPTGSGKTLAFGIPMVARIGTAEPRKPRGLVLVPTRELASQVRDELAILAGQRGKAIEAFYGGNGFDRQLKALRRGVDIAVACPGRLADLINRGDIRLDHVEFVVIDEADRMADMGFLPEVRRILDQTPEKRQTLLFSATLDGDIDVLVKHYQRKPSRHELASNPTDGAKVTHLFWNVARDQRVALCAQVVASSGSTIVFCRTKRGADRVARQLEQSGLRTAAIHGDRSQSQRERALAAFHDGRIDALVATDVAARGIHVDNVGGVVHLDPPADEKDYVHRSGRTGRAGAAGVVVSFVAPEQRKDVTKMQKLLKMAPGIGAPDTDALPSIDRPVRKPKFAAPRHDDTPRRDGPARGGPRRARTFERSDRPARSRSEWADRSDRADRPSSSERTERTGRPAAAKPGRSARPGASGRSAGAGDEGRAAAKPYGKPAGKPGRPSAKSTRAPAKDDNRKARREHLQAGPAARSDGPSRSAKRAAGPNPDKGKRRQASGGR